MNLGVLDLFMIFLITMGPGKGAIVYVALTAEADANFRRKVAIKTVTTATIVALLFVLAGEVLLNAFHVSHPALKLAGGLILMLFALEMVMGSKSKENDTTGAEPSTDIGVFPLAIPLMATPQGLVAIVTITAATPGTQELVMIVGLILAVMAINLVFFLGAHRILSAIGPSALKVVSVIVGLLLVALAVQLMIWGLIDLGALEKLPAVG